MFDLRLILNSLGVLACLFALWKGGAAERWAAAVVILNVLVGQSGQYLAAALNDQIRLVNDGLTALILLGVTVRFGALWMGGVMLFYGAQFALHSFYLVTERPTDYLYALINNIDYSSILWCLVIGTILAWRRRIRLDRAAAAA